MRNILVKLVYCILDKKAVTFVVMIQSEVEFEPMFKGQVFLKVAFDLCLVRALRAQKCGFLLAFILDVESQRSFVLVHPVTLQAIECSRGSWKHMLAYAG